MEKVYTVEEVAELLRVSTRSIYDLIATGELKASKIGRLYRITTQALDEYMSSVSQTPQPLKRENVLIVTRHMGTVEWLRKRGIVGPVVERASRTEVTGRVVYGVLPLYLAAMAKEVRIVETPVPVGNGNELSVADLDRLKARIVSYKVTKEDCRE